MIQPLTDSVAHKRIPLPGLRIHTILAATAPHSINQNLANKGKALRTWVPSFGHDDRCNAPFLPLLALTLQVGTLTGCSDCHIRIISQSVPCSIGIHHTVKPPGQHILRGHVYSLFIGPRARIGIDLGVKDSFSIIVIGLPEHCRFCSFHVVHGGFYQGI